MNNRGNIKIDNKGNEKADEDNMKIDNENNGRLDKYDEKRDDVKIDNKKADEDGVKIEYKVERVGLLIVIPPSLRIDLIPPIQVKLVLFLLNNIKVFANQTLLHMKKILLNLANIFMLLILLIISVASAIAFLHYYNYEYVNANIYAMISLSTFAVLAIKIAK